MSARVVHPDDPRYLKAAFSMLGLSEIEGEEDEPQVLAMYRACGRPEIRRDEVPWCAAYVGWCLHRGGLPNTGSLLAISYAKYPGKKLTRDDTIPRGAICVWPRSEGSGHVNFALEDQGDAILCIGGNQGNSRGGGVTIVKYPKYQLKIAVVPKMRPGDPIPVPKPKPPIEAPEPEKPPKTGMSEGAKAGTGLGILGILSQVWDAITQAPEHLLELIARTAQKPSVWIFAGVVCVGAFIWWRRHQMKKSEA